jgi:quercetin dioxygenase-like cupin family protein
MPRQGGPQWFETTSQAKPFSDRFCPKTSTGSHSRRSHLRSLAVVVGQPSEPGPYVTRVKVPSGVKLMPHRHPEDRIYTVMSGVFYIGLGDQFDDDKVKAYPPGSVIVLPGNTPHFHWAKSGEYVTRVTAIGPLGLECLDPADDPREPRKTKKGQQQRK